MGDKAGWAERVGLLWMGRCLYGKRGKKVKKEGKRTKVNNHQGS
jgi:hypothetical protein